MTHYEKMMNTDVKKLVLSLSIPTVISMLITAIYSIADTYFVTHIDKSASAAVSIVFSLQTLIQAIGFTIGMGSGSLISRSLGAKENKKASQYASQGVLVGLILGILLLVLGLLLNSQIMKLLGSTDTALPYAIDFAKWIFIASPFMIISFILNNVLRSEGKPKLSMIGLGAGSILNIGLDPLLIFGFDLGISGAGIATMISQIISFMILCSFFLFNKTTCKIWYKYITLDVKSYLMAFYCGAPTLCRQGFSTSANIIINFLAGPYGDALVAALGITAKVYLFVRNIVIGIGQGYQPILGFSYGAKRYDRIRKAFIFTVTLQTGVSLAAALIVGVFPHALASFFSDNIDVVDISTKSIRFLLISLPFLGFSTIVNQSLQVIGRSVSASLLASCRQGIIYTPLIFILHKLIKDTGLMLAQPISDFLTALVSIPACIYFFKILSKKEKESLVEMNYAQ